MKVSSTIIVVFIIGLTSGLCNAASYFSGYDINLLLSKPHPFSVNSGFYGYESFQANKMKSPYIRSTARRDVKIKSDSKNEVVKKLALQENVRNSYLGWLSEIRVGILKHSASISTSTPKEKGIDGNFEVLFASPKYLKFLWSPRPHIGMSANTSDKDTDLFYSGLTWGWQPLKYLFIDASFGISLHNGVRDVKSSDPLYGRVREFGCDWLFRESIEIGTPLGEHHKVSLMWDHVSHGGVCGSENEGMDNLGVRYGYEF